MACKVACKVHCKVHCSVVPPKKQLPESNFGSCLWGRATIRAASAGPALVILIYLLTFQKNLFFDFLKFKQTLYPIYLYIFYEFYFSSTHICSRLLSNSTVPPQEQKSQKYIVLIYLSTFQNRYIFLIFEENDEL